MKTFLKTFVKDDAGASAAEYALILAVVGVAIGGAAVALSGSISTAMLNAADRVNDCSATADSTTPDTQCPVTAVPD